MKSFVVLVALLVSATAACERNRPPQEIATRAVDEGDKPGRPSAEDAKRAGAQHARDLDDEEEAQE
jgi:hypothetical protein